MSDFLMPSLGADMEDGTLVEWLKKPGDPISRGEIVAVVETQKGAIEIEAFEDGILSRILVEPGNQVPVGTVIAEITPAGGSESEVARTSAPPPPPAPPSAPAEQAPPPEEIAAPSAPLRAPAEGVKISPAARKLANEKGVDVNALSPGSSGVIGLAEVEAAVGKAATAPKPGPAESSPVREPTKGGVDLAAMRKAIAAAMSRSHRDIPHYWVGHTVDLTRMLQWLESENRSRGVADRLLFVVPLIKAIAIALKEVPDLNGHYVDDSFRPSEAIHVGVATALRGGGLIAPAILDVDRLDLDGIRVALSGLVRRARAGRLRASEMTGGTITFSNLGEGMSATIISLIYPPQVAIVGCGAPVDRPAVVDGDIVIRRLMNVTVAGDHRVSDGRRASQFLGRFARAIETLEGIR